VAGATKDGGEGVLQGGTAHFTVDPDRVVKLRDDVKAIEDELNQYLRVSGLRNAMKPPGTDPVSFDTAAMFTGNGERALEAATSFSGQLKDFRESLDAAIKKYQLSDETAERTFKGRSA
jgi:PE family protein